MTAPRKVVVITGAARSIGLATAKRFAADGAAVLISDIDEAQGHAAAAQFDGASEVKFARCDVGNRDDVDNLVVTALREWGAIDVLVNNAGIVHAANFLEVTEADFDRVLRVNLKGMFLVGQAVARQMVKQVNNGGKPGAIVNLSSVNAVVTIAGQTPYCASKGGVDQLTKVMALNLAEYGIRVNAIGPGSIMTDMLLAGMNSEDARHRVLSRTPMGRIGEASEIASIAAFLASDDASYVTGQTIYADGGRLTLNYTVPVKSK